MKIERVHTQLVELPLARPIATSIHTIQSVGCVCLTLTTEDGLSGESFVFALNSQRLRAFDEAIRGFEHQLLGLNPHYTGRLRQSIWQELNPSGHKGITISAMSALDTACWDLVGKSLGQPLHRVFGACRDRIDTYASGGLWLSHSIDQLVEEAQEFVALGFRGVKIRVGSENQKQDVERVAAVRRAIGGEVELFADANQAFTPKQAISLSRALEPFNLVWLEEPVVYNDLAGQAYVRERSPVTIAAGETEYTSFGMHELLQHKTCDVLMPDLQRIGGLSELLASAQLAKAHHIPVSPHFFTEYSLCAAGAMPGCISVEHIPWFETLFNEELLLQDGMLQIPDRPGTGFTFNPDALSEYSY